jgi:hypothetical protein
VASKRVVISRGSYCEVFGSSAAHISNQSFLRFGLMS